MSNEYKVFDDGGLTALTEHMKATRTKANSNEAAVSTLGEDLAELSSEVVAALGNKQDKLTFDTTPTANSANPVTSGGVKSALDGKADNGHTHTAAQVGALPSSTVIPTKTSDLTNDSGFVTSDHTHDFSELTVTDTAAAKTALDVEEGMVYVNSKMDPLNDWDSVAYGNGRFIAIPHHGGQNGAYSEDGIVWTPIEMPSRPDNKQVIVYAFDKFIILPSLNSWGSTYHYAYSEDGITWTSVALSNVLGTAYSWAYGDGLLLVTTNNSVEGGRRYFYTSDGVQWNASYIQGINFSTSDGACLNTWKVAYGNGRFVVVDGFAGHVMYSEDGLNWVAASNSFGFQGAWNLIYGDGKFILSSNKMIYYSTDGDLWTSQENGLNESITITLYANNKFLGVVYRDDLPVPVYSNDGLTWMLSTFPIKLNYLNNWCYGGDKFITLTSYVPTGSGCGLGAFSFDGITWQTELKQITQSGEDITAQTLEVLAHTHSNYQTTLTGSSGQMVGFDANGKAVAQDMPSSAYVLRTDDADSPVLTSGSYAEAYAAFTNGSPVSLRWIDIDFQLVDYNSVDNTLRFSNFPLYDSDSDTVSITAFTLSSDNTLTITKNATLAEVDHSHPGLDPVTTSGDGAAYTATVEGITALTTGASFIMIPNVVSTSTAPTLNINDLGAKTIRRPISTNTATTVAAESASWLAADKPIRVTYNGTYWVADMPKPYATDLYGTVPAEKGGTPAVTTSDNGKFLRVVNGAWAAVSISNAEEASF